MEINDYTVSHRKEIQVAVRHAILVGLTSTEVHNVITL